ncbi:LysM domain-containing protein, partial [Hahella sp. HN01]|uniref:LysM peptidoglycan-binding domain-containing protein n=1 Tax=Hahella sp. HN01 TaxID=2847262 RepID=UPI001C1EC0DD
VKERLESLHHYDYNANNQVLTDTVYKDASMSPGSRKSILTYTYLNDGQTLKQTFLDDLANDDGDVTTTYHYLARDRWDSYKASKVTISASVGAGASYYIYDANGHTRWVYDHQDQRTISYVNNQRGQTIQRNEIDRNNNGQEKSIRRKFYYLDGIVRGDIGNDGVPSRTDYVQQLAENGDHSVVVGQESYLVPRSAGRDDNRNWFEARTRDIKKQVGYSSYYRMTPVTSADFDQNFQPINSDYPGKASSYYEVHEGDKLSSIAASMWGDASLWYLLADANGLSGDQDLKAGLSLVIPNVVTNIHNNASTFRPYDPGLGLGDTTPSLPEPPPPPKKGKCGATFVVMVIAIAVAAIVAPYATAMLMQSFGPAAAAAQGAASVAGGLAASVGSSAGVGFGLSAGVGAGFGAVSASVGVATSFASYAAMAGGVFIGGVAGSAVSQLAAKELDLQDHFSLRSAVRNGLTATATAGVNSFVNASGWYQWAQMAATAAAGVGANYLAGKATKLPTTFRWRDVATSFATASVMNGIGIGDKSAFYNQGLSSYVDGFLPGSIRNNDIARNAIQGFTAGAVSEAVRVAVYDSEDYRPDYVGMIAGVVGSTLGGLALAGVAKESQQSSAATVSATEKSYSDDYLYKYGIASLDGEGPVGPAYELNYLQERDETFSELDAISEELEAGIEYSRFISMVGEGYTGQVIVDPVTAVAGPLITAAENEYSDSGPIHKNHASETNLSFEPWDEYAYRKRKRDFQFFLGSLDNMAESSLASVGYISGTINGRDEESLYGMSTAGAAVSSLISPRESGRVMNRSVGLYSVGLY